jgi:HSP20 family protein
MEDVFNRVFGPPVETNGHSKHPAWMPRVDVSETDKAFIVLADLPGVDPKQVDISMDEGVLTIKGTKNEEREEKGKNFHRTERFTGSFYRAIELPGGIDEAGVIAATANGTITITIPKKAGAQPKKVTINTTGA